jgi:ABC-type multidrug transport system fused ATPase/permease subunit
MRKTLAEIKTQLVLGGKVLKLIYASSPKWALLSFCLTFFNAAVPAVMLYLGKLALDATVKAIQMTDTPHIRQVIIWVLLSFVVGIVNTFTGNLLRHINNTLKDYFGKYAIESLVRKAVVLDVAFFEDPKFHDLMEKVQREIYGRPFQIFEETLSILSAVFAIISNLFLIFKLPALFPLLLLLASIPRLILRLRLTFYTYAITDRRSPESRKVNYLIDLLIRARPFVESKLLNLKTFVLKKFEEIYQNFLAENYTTSKKGLYSVFFIDLIGTGVALATKLYVVFQVIFQKLTIGDLSMLSSAVDQTNSRLAELFRSVARFYESNLFLQHYFTYLALEPKIKSPQNGLKISKNKPLKIEFKKVSFGYKPENLILKNINLKISDAKNFALVGENGAGKTTLIKLLIRLYDVTSGEILVNGHSIKEYDLENLWQSIGVTFQNFMTYDLSVKDNIGFGSLEKYEYPDAPATMKKIKEAAKFANAQEFIKKLPQGFNTVLGRIFEKGEELSGGQWQKIALARAFFSDAKVLIMDEPTASLDPKSEYEVFKNLIAATKNKSLILISHRFSTVRLADEIIVLHDGQIVEQGSHEFLMKKNGRYAKLYNLQAKWYK